MICINGYCDWPDSCHGISQSLLISLGYEPVVLDMGNCKSAVEVTGLVILLREIQSLKLPAGWTQNNEPLTGLMEVEPAGGASPLRCMGRCLSTAARC